MYAQRSGRDLTHSLVERIASGHLGAKLRSQVASWHPQATREQLDEAFQEACLRAQLGCRGEGEGEVFTWLRTTTHRELGHMERLAERRLRSERVVDVSAPGFDVPAATGSPEDELIRREDQADIQRVSRALLERLSESQRQVAALHTHGRKRPEIAAQLGLSPRTVKRMLERIMVLSRAELVRLAGHGCESGEGLIARFAFGLAGPREMRQAQHHLATCPRCGALYERLDMWREKVAAALPLPVVQKVRPGFVERALHAAAERLPGFAHHGGREGGLRERLGELSGHVKQHVTAAYYRTVDPTPLAGIRPGAAAATVAGCLAIGGGATYCVQQGVNPIGGLMGVALPAHHQRHEPRHRKAARVVQPPTTPADPGPTPTVTTPVQPVVQAPPQTVTQTQPAPAPQNEFEPNNAAAASTATAPTHTSSSGSGQPAPAAPGGPSEFGGP